jgi:hypothetical protein
MLVTLFGEKTMMTKNKAEVIGERIMTALKQVEDGLDVTIARGKGCYDNESLTLTITATLHAEDGTAQTKEALDFKKWASIFGLKEEDLGARLQLGGSTYIISGCKPKNRKYPIIADEEGTSRKVKMPVDQVKTLLGRG